MPVSLPSFTIPTSRCCSLILPFSDIAAVLDDRPHIVQVSVGELEKNNYQLDLAMDWLHSPVGWPVFLSGFSPANPVFPQVFRYDAGKKCMQVANGPSRVSLTHEAILALARRARRPEINIISLPVEQGGVVTVESPPAKKRKTDRKNQSVFDAVNAIKQNNQFQFVLPDSVTSDQVDPTTRIFKPKLTPIVNGEKSPEKILSEITAALAAGADVLETDFPFHCAKNGWLLDGGFQLLNVRSNEWFHVHSPAVVFEPQSTPAAVVEAGMHSMSYLHHLFRCDELSGPILLATVNLYQFSKFVSKYAKDS